MNTLVQILAGLGGTSFFGTIVLTLLQRRRIRAESGKIGAESADLIIKSATAFADEVREAAREDNTVLREELRLTRSEIAALRRHLSAVERMLRQYLPPDVEMPEFIWPNPERNGR